MARSSLAQFLGTRVARDKPGSLPLAQFITGVQKPLRRQEKWVLLVGDGGGFDSGSGFIIAHNRSLLSLLYLSYTHLVIP